MSLGLCALGGVEAGVDVAAIAGPSDVLVPVGVQVFVQVRRE